MQKAAAYARYSSDNQREESIEAQLRAIREYCERNRMQLVKIYTDEARSATTDDRPGFLQMIQDSAMGLFSAVIVHKLDRFSRDRYDSAFYKRQLKKNGVRLISVLENLDDTPESIILESVLEGMAEYYSANLARETLKGLKENAFEHEAEAVKMIFEMYASGAGYNAIIDQLNLLGHKTKRGKTFGKNSIHEILRNEKYTGVYIYNNAARKVNGKYNNRKRKPDNDIIRIPGGMPRIIEIEIWKKVQDKMEKTGIQSIILKRKVL